RLAFTRYHLDDEGVRVRTAFLGRSERRVPWGKVTLVRHRRTLLDRLFGLSRVEIVAYGDRGAVLHLTGLRDARPVRQRAAMQMRRSASVAGLFRND
ncbi:MAG TPA: PH domain-containing protein, partial [Candidatus Thermoplasmatota archaeon]|nr:PH domain-containing protein [Candidatus Thermoplasmatota archaeon]